MVWFLRKKAAERTPILAAEIPRDRDRAGPVPPPPRTAHAPGISIYRFDAGGEDREEPTLLADRRGTHPTRMLAGSAPPGGRLGAPEDAGLETALLVIAGAAATEGSSRLAVGDFLLAPEAPLENRDGERLVALFDVAAPPPGAQLAATRRIAREDLSGSGFAGISGIRAAYRTASSVGLRLGPPPGIRWVFVGLRGFAVFRGKLTVVDGEEVRDVHAGCFAVVADPTATLYVQAGNDAAVASGFASPGVVVALG